MEKIFFCVKSVQLKVREFGTMSTRRIQAGKDGRLNMQKNIIKDLQKITGMRRFRLEDGKGDLNYGQRSLIFSKTNVLFVPLLTNGSWRSITSMAVEGRNLENLELKAGTVTLKMSWNLSREEKRNIACFAQIVIDSKPGKENMRLLNNPFFSLR